MGRLRDLGWRWSAWGAGAVLTLEGVWGERGQEIRAMSGEGFCAFLWGGTRAVELLCRCWPGARGRGRCTDGYLSIRKCPALQHGWDVSAAVPVSWSPGSLGGPSDRKSQSTPDPPETHSSLTLVPAQRVCTCVREAGQA